MTRTLRGLAFSGGLDSINAWALLGKPVAIYCGGIYGPNKGANAGEMDAINRMALISPEFYERLLVIRHDFTPIMRPGKHHHPRELMIAMLAAANGFDVLAFAFTKEDNMIPEWMAATKEACRLNMDIQVEFPFIDMTKRQMTEYALRADVNPELIRTSWSCVRESVKPCGTCENCKHREQVFTQLELHQGEGTRAA